MIKVKTPQGIVRIDHRNLDNLEIFTITCEADLGPEFTHTYYSKIEATKIVRSTFAGPIEEYRVDIKIAYSKDRLNYSLEGHLMVVVFNEQAQKVFSSIKTYYQKLLDRIGWY